jgi:hypothetical protein
MDKMYNTLLEKLGNYFKNKKWFRKSYLGFEWFLMKNPKANTKTYLSWEEFK